MRDSRSVEAPLPERLAAVDLGLQFDERRAQRNIEVARTVLSPAQLQVYRSQVDKKLRQDREAWRAARAEELDPDHMPFGWQESAPATPETRER